MGRDGLGWEGKRGEGITSEPARWMNLMIEHNKYS